MTGQSIVVGPAGPGDPGDAGLYRLPGRGGGQAAAGGLPARRDAVRAAVPGEGRQEPGNPGAARPGGHILAYLEAAGIAGEAKDPPLFRATQGKTQAADRQAADDEDLRDGQAAAQGCRAAVAAVAALVPGDGDHLPAQPGRAAGHWPTILPPLIVLSRLSLARSADNASARFILQVRPSVSMSHALGRPTSELRVMGTNAV